jgi:hypothetical protein
MPQRSERLQIPSRPAAEIEDRERRSALDVAQECADVLADVVVLGPGAEVLRAPLVVLERRSRNPREFRRIQPAQAATASFVAARIARAAASKAAGSGEATLTRLACESRGKFVGAERL